jgi:hypothetical protein
VPQFVEVNRKWRGKLSQTKSDIADEIEDADSDNTLSDSDTVTLSDETSSQVHGPTLTPCLPTKVDKVDKGKGKAGDVELQRGALTDKTARTKRSIWMS